MKKTPRPLVGIIMGSDSDWPTMEAAWQACAEFGVPCETNVVSAHRTPDDMFRYAKTAQRRGLRVIIAGAGGAAHLPGICTIERSESRPLRLLLSTGTPMTGSVVWLATMPGRWAAPPAPAMIRRSPRRCAVLA